MAVSEARSSRVASLWISNRPETRDRPWPHPSSPAGDGLDEHTEGQRKPGARRHHAAEPRRCGRGHAQQLPQRQAPRLWTDRLGRSSHDQQRDQHDHQVRDMGGQQRGRRPLREQTGHQWPGAKGPRCRPSHESTGNQPTPNPDGITRASRPGYPIAVAEPARPVPATAADRLALPPRTSCWGRDTSGG
jgi:hypothetical protein